jgi:transposase
MEKAFLSKKDRKKIDGILDSEKEVKTFRRALILKMLNDGYSQKAIGDLHLRCERTVRGMLMKYESGGLDAALYDKPRTGQPRKFNKRQETHIAAVVCSEPPLGNARWTLTLLKEHFESQKIVDSISIETLRIMLVSRDIKPWKHKMWCIPTVDAAFIKQMEEVLAVYEKPYNKNEPVVCIDEKPIQLLDSERKEMLVRGSTRQDYEYVRNGVVNAFCAVEPKAGKHFNEIRERKTMTDFAHVVKKIIDAYPNAKTIHLVMDNLSTHKEKALIQTFGENVGQKLWNKITPHYTPKHASWLNQAEIEISMFSRTCLGKQRVADIESLKTRSLAWRNRMNKNKIKINWQFSRKKARAKFKYKSGKN